MKKKVSKRGGYRPGAGAKKTGRNTTCISFSVHKDFAELIKSMVKSKIIELKQSQNQSNTATVYKPKEKETCVEAAARRMKQKSKFKPQPFTSAYLQSRRSKKLGLK